MNPFTCAGRNSDAESGWTLQCLLNTHDFLLHDLLSDTQGKHSAQLHLVSIVSNIYPILAVEQCLTRLSTRKDIRRRFSHTELDCTCRLLLSALTFTCSPAAKLPRSLIRLFVPKKRWASGDAARHTRHRKCADSAEWEWIWSVLFHLFLVFAELPHVWPKAFAPHSLDRIRSRCQMHELAPMTFMELYLREWIEPCNATVEDRWHEERTTSNKN